MRNLNHLRRRYAMILSSLGVIFLLSGLVMLTPLLILPAYPEEGAHAWAFLVPAGGLVLLGLALWGMFRSASGTTLSVEDGGIVVLASWAGVILFSAWPFVTILDLPFSRAVFESMSGWTTTGLSVVDVRGAGPMILLWRSVIQLAGGAGLAIIMMSAIIGPAGPGISSAEGRGDQLVPHVRQSARLVLVMYVAYALVGIVAYWFAGMSLFDAVNHSFAAVSTGGFSTRVESIGYWDSVSVEAVTLALMLVGNMSFVTAWFLWRGKLRTVARNGEVRLMAVLIPLSAGGAFFLTCQGVYPQLEKAIRIAVFETVSALTTTGFSTVGYTDWNGFGILLLVILMLVGGGTCSTAGAMKQYRIHLLFNALVWDIRRALMPRHAILERSVWDGDRRLYIDDGRVRQVTVFVVLYLTVFMLGVLVLTACGFSLEDSLFEFASALGTVGLSVGVTSATMPDAAIWAETMAMFLGRLEFFVIIFSVLAIGRDGRQALACAVKESGHGV